MENWGLVTYGESGLLVDEEVDNPARKYSVGGLMGHEVAHMWFGDILTCKWWSHAWLNEGHATVYSNPAMLYIDDSFRVDELEGVRAQNTMTLDSSFPNVPTVVNVQHPQELGLAFGSMTYQKGAAVARMLKSVMTESTYKKGLNRYFNKHLYGVAETDDLWAAMTEQAAADGVTDTDGSPLNIKSKLDSWVLQVGFPKITVTRNGDGTASVNQYIYLQDPNEDISQPSPFNYKWNVPLAYTTSDERNFTYVTRTWMNQENITLSGLPTGPGSWIWLNNEHIAFIRVDYDADNRKAMIDQLVSDPTVVPNNNKLQLINDMYVFVSSGMYKELDAIQTTKFLDKEQSANVWDVAFENFGFIDQILRFRPSFSNFQRYIRKLADPIYAGVSWDVADLSYDALMKRAVLFPAACAFGNTDCLSKSYSQLQNWVNNPSTNPIRTDLRSHVYCYGLASPSAKESDWNFLFERYLESTKSTETQRLAQAFTCTQQVDLMSRLLDWSLTTGPAEDLSTIWWSAASSPIGRPLVWNHLRDNWASTPLGNLKYSTLSVVVSTFSSQDELDQLNALIEEYPPGDDLENSTFASARNTVQSNIKWVTQNEADLVQFFDQEAPSGVEYSLGQKLRRRSRDPKIADRIAQLSEYMGVRDRNGWMDLARKICEDNVSRCAFFHQNEIVIPIDVDIDDTLGF